jgi:hypothetical protein
LVKVDLVHATLVVQAHFSGETAKVFKDPVRGEVDWGVRDC